MFTKNFEQIVDIKKYFIKNNSVRFYMSLTDTLLNITRIFFPTITLKCTHDKVLPNAEQAYCPDCGKLIQNEWYVTRCNCCGIKVKAMIKNGQIVPQSHYCKNCGAEDYIIEKINKINFIDINFAVLIRKEIEERFCNTTKCWQEKTFEQPKLLTQYL